MNDASISTKSHFEITSSIIQHPDLFHPRHLKSIHYSAEQFRNGLLFSAWKHEFSDRVIVNVSFFTTTQSNTEEALVDHAVEFVTALCTKYEFH